MQISKIAENACWMKNSGEHQRKFSKWTSALRIRDAGVISVGRKAGVQHVEADAGHAAHRAGRVHVRAAAAARQRAHHAVEKAVELGTKARDDHAQVEHVAGQADDDAREHELERGECLGGGGCSVWGPLRGRLLGGRFGVDRRQAHGARARASLHRHAITRTRLRDAQQQVRLGQAAQRAAVAGLLFAAVLAHRRLVGGVRGGAGVSGRAQRTPLAVLAF